MNNLPSISQRKDALKKLLKNIIIHEEEILEALYKDYKKPRFEGIVTETSYIISELKNTINKIDSWSKPKWVFPSLLNFPSSDYIYSEPYGKVLIISPWNYPFQLAISPLIAAVAAGNTVTLKPSELTPYTSGILSKIIRESFEVKHVVAVTGDYTIAQDLLKKRWDYIFFTGSVTVGKIVAKAAAENLTPITLELGGKNPCIVDESANLQLAAKRIIWGKILNAGQTCIAPDYILVHHKMKSKLINYLIDEIKKALGENPQESEDFARIINLKNWERQLSLIENQNIISGGQSSKNDFYLAPTLLDEPHLDSPVMKDEIFGPILPILSYQSKTDIESTISKYEKSLSLFIFSENKSFIKEVLNKYSFGGGCVNDTIIHFSNSRLPFGGVGHSGIGAYHGKLSFDTFSHKKSIVRKGNWLDLPLRYAPYKNKVNIIKRILNWL
ncbi:aldehyde dehydrogenase [Flavobacterium psychrophilum]|uniref:Aldehyde dehydrogenase n=1 Tax=Flavobacterium psychrophilum (strain ATCC 49511 / DSM 21280 / CIP 103535 / JIP02/86) TaxID=402612 RepID=A6GY15_FLAPJ|nr:aldehyde dehydrogenase [Flavobacterium psychrophilum]AIG29712.1 aldehyde dehydrogenase [Flavobacterium psychrophilum]AIG31989.1 aldehyde dehydrogenase [Flavobacterium psychrophilum]AIG34144.1 aldehyde dehydrogenase [Flavobacterium psychrophilum]AIG36507.1 aldehyde dehydrogenase [Flavobacterium psychrophilum]AIG38772.1 aldehyde dehydrogenase [Flavobacterium psychrophilum]